MPKKTGVEAAKSTLVDTVRDEVLSAFKEMPGLFAKMNEANQRDWIERAAIIAHKVVGDCCDVIAADGRTVLDGSVGNVIANKTTFEGKVSISKDAEDAFSFIEAAHGSVKIAFVNNGKHLEETTRPAAAKDQPSLYHDDKEHGTAEAIKEGIKKAGAKSKKREGLPDAAIIKDRMDRAKAAEPLKAADKKPPARKKKTTRTVQTKAGGTRKAREVQVVETKRAKAPTVPTAEDFSLVE